MSGGEIGTRARNNRAQNEWIRRRKKHKTFFASLRLRCENIVGCLVDEETFADSIAALSLVTFFFVRLRDRKCRDFISIVFSFFCSFHSIFTARFSIVFLCMLFFFYNFLLPAANRRHTVGGLLVHTTAIKRHVTSHELRKLSPQQIFFFYFSSVVAIHSVCNKFFFFLSSSFHAWKKNGSSKRKDIIIGTHDNAFFFGRKSNKQHVHNCKSLNAMLSTHSIIERTSFLRPPDSFLHCWHAFSVVRSSQSQWVWVNMCVFVRQCRKEHGHNTSDIVLYIRLRMKMKQQMRHSMRSGFRAKVRVRVSLFVCAFKWLFGRIVFFPSSLSPLFFPYHCVG